jgi:2-hydroxy-6-oxonona-2,4-dienedioate hydrolase
VSFWLSLTGISHSVGWRDIDGVHTRVLEAGLPEANPVLLLHGTGGHLEAFVHNVAALATTAHVVAYDLPGHGWSSAPNRSYEIDGYIRHLESLLDALGAERAALIGQSLGGWIATRFAYERPERVERLLLVGPGGTVSDAAVMQEITDSSLAAVTGPTAESVRRRLQLIIADPACISDELVNTRLLIYGQAGAADRMRRVLCLQEPAIRERNLLTARLLAAVHQPALLVAGDRDEITPLGVCRQFAELLPAGRLHIMPGCGHWPQFERSADFNAVARAFMADGHAPITTTTSDQPLGSESVKF